MVFSDIQNNDALIDSLAQRVKKGRIHHSYIFVGNRNAPKLEIAKMFFSAIVCESGQKMGCGRCPNCIKIDTLSLIDFTIIRASETAVSKVKSIKDEDIIYLQERLMQSPMDCSYNFAVIENADAMTVRAQNRLLKTLEEPAKNTVMILLVENSEFLIETI
ncbi:MAG: hypothetical protein ACRCUS_03000, partial [Anaerovoracaceae bacterium]